MTRELRAGDRVTLGKGRTRYTLVAIIRGAVSVESVDYPLPRWRDVAVGVISRTAGTYWRGKTRGRGRRVELDRLRLVNRAAKR